MKRYDEIGAAIALLAETFPKCFAVFEQRRQPLKIGIHADIAAALDGAITLEELSNALRFYTGNVGYLRSLRAGAPRIDLDGQPAGVVTAEETAFAKTRLRAQRKNSAKPAVPTAAPKRLGLADLKAAALQRRAIQEAGR
jgi:ProP effector